MLLIFKNCPYSLIKPLTYQNFQREPRIAHALNVEERHVRVGLGLVQHPGQAPVGRPDRGVPYHRHSHIRMGFQAEGQNRHTYEEHRYHTNYLRNVTSSTELEYLINLGFNNLGLAEAALPSRRSTHFGSIGAVRFIEQGPNLRFHVLPPGNRSVVVVVLVAKFPRQLLFRGLFRVQVQPFEDGQRFLRVTMLKVETEREAKRCTRLVVSVNFRLFRTLFNLDCSCLHAERW